MPPVEAIDALREEVHELREDLQKVYLTKEETQQQFLSRSDARQHRFSVRLFGTLLVVLLGSGFLYNRSELHGRCVQAGITRAELVRVADEAVKTSSSALPPGSPAWLVDFVQKSAARTKTFDTQVHKELPPLACP